MLYAFDSENFPMILIFETLRAPSFLRCKISAACLPNMDLTHSSDPTPRIRSYREFRLTKQRFLLYALESVKEKLETYVLSLQAVIYNDQHRLSYHSKYSQPCSPSKA